jgi:hypothetical protein
MATHGIKYEKNCWESSLSMNGNQSIIKMGQKPKMLLRFTSPTFGF